MTQREPVKEYAVHYDPPPRSVTWDVHIAPPHGHHGPRFCLALQYDLIDGTHRSGHMSLPFTPVSRAQAEPPSSVLSVNAHPGNAEEQARHEALLRVNSLFDRANGSESWKGVAPE